jgi:N-dimethylarginine dimethylaminohydrolase
MNPPLTLDTNIPNNRSMSLLSDKEREVDFDRAMSQWLELYRSLCKESLVYLLPSSKPLQDLTFVSNIGVVLNHLKIPVAIVSNFRAEGRQGESAVGRNFFSQLGYEVHIPDSYFEGEADFKHLSGNLYFGGYGLRSSRESHQWFMDQFNAEVISIKLNDPHLFHLDCAMFVLDKETILLCTSICDNHTIRTIEKHCRIIDVPIDLAYRGATNSVRCGSNILTESLTGILKKSDQHFDVEKKKRAFMEKIADENKLDISFFNLNEFHKSGAMLSCLIMPLYNI